MYPKMSTRNTADGKILYTYVCKMKERSRKSVCASPNINGNTLDMAVIEQIKTLQEDEDTFLAQLEQNRRFYTENRMDYEQQSEVMKKEKAKIQKKIHSLADSLADRKNSSARDHITTRMEQLSQEYLSLEQRIQELNNLTSQHTLNNTELELLCQLLTLFKNSFQEMTIEQKRAAIRTIVHKVIWDDGKAHVILSGVKNTETKY